MVTLNKIYTRTGDGGATRLATGESVPKSHARVEAYGAVDETNACLGLVRLHTGDAPELDARGKRVARRSGLLKYAPRARRINETKRGRAEVFSAT